jgi:hypothetical protein
LLVVGGKTVRTNVYVDGFNLYYGAGKYTAYKWLDLAALCNRLLPATTTLNYIRYFTAEIADKPDDPQRLQRQRLYLRALRTIPKLTIHLGHYIETPARYRLANPIAGLPDIVDVIKTEEKGSDVNLGAYLLMDAHNGYFDQAIVISNDSDLATPMWMIKKVFGLPIGVWNPHSKATCDRWNAAHPECAPRTPHPSNKLKKASKFRHSISSDGADSDVALCQFPEELTDPTGTFRRPKDW